jgi:hypothetical protein
MAANLIRNREEGSYERRLVAMSPRVALRLAFVVLALVAMTAALAELASGRRPVLLGGRPV